MKKFRNWNFCPEHEWCNDSAEWRISYSWLQNFCRINCNEVSDKNELSRKSVRISTFKTQYWRLWPSADIGKVMHKWEFRDDRIFIDCDRVKWGGVLHKWILLPMEIWKEMKWDREWTEWDTDYGQTELHSITNFICRSSGLKNERQQLGGGWGLKDWKRESRTEIWILLGKPLHEFTLRTLQIQRWQV